MMRIIIIHLRKVKMEYLGLGSRLFLQSSRQFSAAGSNASVQAQLLKL